jgi:hypothetical protein
MRPYFKKPFTKIGLDKWLKVKTLSSSPSTAKKKKRKKKLIVVPKTEQENNTISSERERFQVSQWIS